MNYPFIISLIIFLLSLGLCQSSLAAANGPYVGVQIGWANIHQGEFIAYHLNELVHRVFPEGDINKPLKIVFNDTGFAGRLFAGYQFDKYFAVEVGYYRFARLDFTTTLNVEVAVFRVYSLPMDITAHATVNTYVVDLVGKGMWPVTDKFKLYAKFGLAYINTDGTVSIAVKTTILSVVDLSASLSSTPSVNLIYPTLGLGMAYNIAEHFSADLSYTRIQQFTSNSFPSIDFIAVGLIYHFN